jgi:hypothetical protein
LRLLLRSAAVFSAAFFILGDEETSAKRGCKQEFIPGRDRQSPERQGKAAALKTAALREPTANRRQETYGEPKGKKRLPR